MNPTLLVYNVLGHKEDYVLQSDGEDVPDLSAVSRMTMTVGGTVVDSDVHTGAFDWSQTVSAAEAAVHPEVKAGLPKVIFAFGAAGLTAGTYPGSLLVVYDPDNPLGMPWGLFDVVVI